MLARLLIIPSTVLCLLTIGYVVFTTGIHPRSYSIPAGSMAPALVPGELIFASGGFYASHTPIPGDIVLFNVQREGKLTTFIKRVIAAPGDRVKMERGRLYLNGVLVERSPLPPDPAVDEQRYRETLPDGRSYEIAEVSDDQFQDDMPEILIEPGHYFVLGDNRDRSNDSRFPQFGTVPLAAIADRASIIWMSRDWRRIGKRLQPNP
jgi:signal peptidase I